jgi:hypothetical protein
VYNAPPIYPGLSRHPFRDPFLPDIHEAPLRWIG